MQTLNWHKSSYSDNTGCVSVAPLPDGGMAVRDDKHPDGPSNFLSFNPDEWGAFIEGAKRGEFDL
jgi:hypothetical protein